MNTAKLAIVLKEEQWPISCKAAESRRGNERKKFV
jgi:hypothetical protein